MTLCTEQAFHKVWLIGGDPRRKETPNQRYSGYLKFMHLCHFITVKETLTVLQTFPANSS